jgi:hypothetical protein
MGQLMNIEPDIFSTGIFSTKKEAGMSNLFKKMAVI